MTAQALTRQLGAFVAGLDASRTPRAARETAIMGLIDCLGVMVAGRNEDAPRLLLQTLAPQPGPSSLMLTEARVSAPEAAWINGTAAHALDFDDVALRSHPSTVIVPAILAEAEHLDLSGSRLITAYIAGYEIWAELSLRDHDSLHAKGWHPTSVLGAVSAAAACASLRGLNAEQTAVAIALGGSHSSGLMANFGTMTKPYHAGHAAYCGVIAARLAAAGFTASLDAIEHPQGLLSAVSQFGNVDKDRPALLGNGWHIVNEGLNIKRFPVCYCAHRSIQSILSARAEQPFRAEDVDTIVSSISDRHMTILRNSQPQTGLEAKFSMQFAMASAVIAGNVGLSQLTDDFVLRDDVQAMMKRVRINAGTVYDPTNNPNAAPFDQVTVYLKSGQEIRGPEVRQASGHAKRPLSRKEFQEKFVDCLKVGGMERRASELFERLLDVESKSARQLTR